MSATPTVRRDSRSYRQGLVLGLTMAETMLLLIFCVLMAAAMAFTRTLAEIKDYKAANQNLTDANDKAQVKLREAQDKIELMTTALPSDPASADWRRLVLANTQAIKTLEKAGISLKEAADAAPLVSQAIQLHKGGADQGEVAASIRLWLDIKKELSTSADQLPRVSEVPAIVRRGIKVGGGRQLSPEEVVAVASLEQQGVTITEVGKAAPFIAEAIKVYREDPADDLAGSIALGEAIRAAFPAANSNALQREEIISLIREGLLAQTAGTNSGNGGHNWPPIITLSEANGHYFETGSAALPPRFRAALSGKVIEELLGNIKKYPDVNVIEVIGHTDEQPIWPLRPSNLDQTLKSVLDDGASVVQLKPADNAGLGLARAISVAQVLRSDKRLAAFSILPYSAAQLVDVDDMVSITGVRGGVRERRRIEIRLRKSDKIVILPPGTFAAVRNTPSTVSAEEENPTPTGARQTDAFSITTKPQEQPAPSTVPPQRIFQPFRWFRN